MYLPAKGESEKQNRSGQCPKRSHYRNRYVVFRCHDPTHVGAEGEQLLLNLGVAPVDILDTADFGHAFSRQSSRD